MIPSVIDSLQQIAPISLSQMDGVKLLDRVDTKFMFNEALLPSLIKAMGSSYYVLEIANQRFSNYETLYFDTKDFDLYRIHHNGKLNRFKFRCRKYVESNLHFFEVKFKNNKGRTIKDRIKRPEIIRQISGKAEELVKSVTNVDPALLQPKLWVNYVRITFVNKISQERLTIDTDLTFVDDYKKVKLEGLVITEVKQGKASDTSPFISLMRQNKVLQNSISKYCLGVISLNPAIKKNRFKPTLLYINKLLSNYGRLVA